jgi:ABC-2 type transport system permease protein
MRIVRAILTKELRELWRDPLSLTLALILPIILLLLFTYGLNLDSRRVDLGLLDLDRSPTSHDLLASITASADLQVRASASTTRELEEWLDRGLIQAGLVIPPDFERTLLRGERAEVQLLVDGATPPSAKAALAQIDAATAFYVMRLNAAMSGHATMGPLVIAHSRVWFNPELRSVNYIVPGLFSLILMMLPPLLSALAIVRERERGSIQQILVAPVSPLAFIVGKAIPYGGLAFLQMLLVLGAGLLWFQIPFRGSLLIFLLGSAIYVFCTVGVGLLVSTLTRSQVVAMIAVLVVTIMPSFLFSGFIYPVYTLPERYQILSLFFPARHFSEFARELALKNAALGQLWAHLAALLALTGGLLVLAVSRFHRRMG